MKTLFTFVVIGMVSIGFAYAGEPIGSVEAIQGTAFAEGEDGTARTLQEGSEIFLKDTVVTREDAKVRIRFIDDSIVGQGEKSTMLIDEYVFNPKVKEQNGTHLSLFKGVFRVITDKITKLNPERFKVSTKYGTIGIRGCDLGFEVTDLKDNILIVDLHGIDSVVVTLNENKDLGIARDEVLIDEPGQGVTLSPDEGLQVYQFADPNLNKLKKETTPASAQYEDRGTESLGAELNTASAQDPRKKLTSDEVDDQKIDELVSDVVHGIKASELDQEPAGPDVPDMLVEQTQNIGEEVEEEFPQVIRGPKNTLVSGSGIGWSWGAWAQEIKTVHSSGHSDKVFNIGSYTEGDKVSPAEYTEIMGGPPVFLSGSGAAGAVITDGSLVNALSGTLNLGVQLGGVVPAWAGSFDMSGGGDSLQFDAAGGFEGSGKMTGGVDGFYSLNAFGNSYGAPASESIGGDLIKKPGASSPLTANDVGGAVLKFDFDHGGGVKASGAGGADF